jgi:ribosomal protein S27AE
MQKPQHIKRIFSNPGFVYLKKHFCPNCHRQMKVVRHTRIVNSQSEEAFKFDFHSGETYMLGDVKFIWEELMCPNCRMEISVRDMLSIENTSKKPNQAQQLDCIKLIVVTLGSALLLTVILSHFFTRIFSDSILYIWTIYACIMIAQTIRRTSVEGSIKNRCFQWGFLLLAAFLVIGLAIEVIDVIPFFR